MSAPHTLVIVGAGYSGALTAIQALRSTPPGTLHVVLIERRARFARGLAYDTADDNLLLNVPAGNMSALAEDPGHFVEYLCGIDPAFGPGSFISRRIYGDYLEDTLEAAERAAAGHLERRSGSVHRLTRDPDTARWRVDLVDGESQQADSVVLSLGHFGPVALPALEPVEGNAGYINNPWDSAAIDRADRSQPIAILGAGHTAIDALFRLASSGKLPDVFLMSRRGLNPQGHRFTPKPPAASVALPGFLHGVPNTVRCYARAIIREARAQAVRGGDWRDTLNSLRPHTPALWDHLSVAERRRFLRRILPYWDIHRHRLAPAAARRLEQLLVSGSVHRVAARVEAASTAGNGIQLRLRRRGTTDAAPLVVGTVINCTGPNYDIGQVTEPLIVQLREAGLIRPDPLRLGMEIDGHYRIIGRDGAAVQGLYYLGPMLKARYWEAIAIPELRVHASQLARQLTDSLG